MFTCRACTRRALTVLLESSLPAGGSRTALGKCTPQHAKPVVRTYATNAVAAKVVKSRGGEQNGNEGDSWRPKYGASKSMERTVERQMEFFDDPYHIAKEVERVLAKDNFDQAVLLTRNASKNLKVTVAWNHLIGYQMRTFKLHAAIKTYNEMKKRAQLPNAQTYTIIFKGCAMSPHPKLAVTEAVKLYNNMLASDRISPNTIHLNAVLQVCAKAEDLETMFTLVKSADKNLRAPNNLTYTTILNALRAKVNKRPDRDVPTQSQEREVQQTIQRAKEIWEEVLRKWRDASIVIDEELVCSMGRILLMGNYHDNDAIFPLLDQTMGITKDTQELSILAWKSLKAERESKEDVEETAKSSDAALLTASPKGGASQPALKVNPGRNTLSMVMTAIENTGKVNLARRYWIILTKNYAIEPDAHNWFALFGALRRGKSSTKAAEYLAEMPKAMMSSKIFRTAMLTCVRDNLNKSSFNNATRMLEIMLTAMRIPDMTVLRTYLRVAYANKRLFDEMAVQKDVGAAKLAWGRQMTVALENLWEPYQIASKQFSFGGLGPVPEKTFVDDEEREAWVQGAAPRAELAALARKMIAAYDRLIFDNMVPDVVAKRLAPRRNALNRFVVKYFESREKYEPGWNRKVTELEGKKEEEEDWKLGADESW